MNAAGERSAPHAYVDTVFAKVERDAHNCLLSHARLGRKKTVLGFEARDVQQLVVVVVDHRRAVAAVRTEPFRKSERQSERGRDGGREEKQRNESVLVFLNINSRARNVGNYASKKSGIEVRK